MHFDDLFLLPYWMLAGIIAGQIAAAISGNVAATWQTALLAGLVGALVGGFLGLEAFGSTRPPCERSIAEGVMTIHCGARLGSSASLVSAALGAFVLSLFAVSVCKRIDR